MLTECSFLFAQVEGAYWDIRNRRGSNDHHYVRIYIAGPFKRLEYQVAKHIPNVLLDIRCHFHMNETGYSVVNENYTVAQLNTSVYTKANLHFPSLEAWDESRIYERIFLDCHLPTHMRSSAPSHVSLVMRHPKIHESHSIHIEGNPYLKAINESVMGKLAVCVRPMTKDFREFALVSSFLLYYWTMGVEHFVLYTFAEGINNEMRAIIEMARSSGMSIELPIWNFGRKGSHEYLQTMNAEVCIHRMLGIFKYVTVIDYDEFIVPVKVGSITNLLSKYEEMGKNSTARRAPGGYKISVAFFYTHLEKWRDVKSEFLTILRKV